MNGDVLTALDYGHLVDVHRETGNVLTIASHRRVVRTEYGVLHFSNQNGNMLNVSGFEEKPEIPYVVSMGVYVLEPAALDYIEPGTYLDLPDLVLRLLAEGRQVGSYLYDGYWLDIGRHEDYEKALIEFEQLRPMFLPERETTDGDCTSEGTCDRRRRLRRRRAGRTSCWRPGTRSACSTCCCTARTTWPRGSTRSAWSCSAATSATPSARQRALEGVDAVVHLAAIVGDPACARDPELSNAVNVEGTRDARRGRPRRRRGALRVRLDLLELRPHGRSDRADRRDRRAAPGVALRRAEGRDGEGAARAATSTACRATCLRFATVYGVGPRMRFDLTVNEFTRDLWADRKLEVFGEPFWRPYVHVRDAARAVALVLGVARSRRSPARVFNAGHSDENYRKLDLVEIITGQLGRGDVAYVHRDEDPRDYKVSFERIKDELGFEPR